MTTENTELDNSASADAKRQVQRRVMCDSEHSEWLDKATIVYNQLKETVDQEAIGVTCRMATITCICGRKRAIVKMYQCLYCKVWMCDQCAEEHFGKTVAEYRAENPVNT